MFLKQFLHTKNFKLQFSISKANHKKEFNTGFTSAIWLINFSFNFLLFFDSRHIISCSSKLQTRFSQNIQGPKSNIFFNYFIS